MPDRDQDFIDAVNRPSPTPGVDRDQDFIDAVKGSGGGATPTATASVTPYTDQAISSSDKWYNWDPPWLRRYEDPVRKALTVEALPPAQGIADFARQHPLVTGAAGLVPGLAPIALPMETMGAATAGMPPGQFPDWMRPAVGAYEETRQMVTPANALITAGMALEPEMIPFVAPLLAAPMVGRLPGQVYRAATGRATPEEMGALAADIGMLAAPAIAHWAVPRPEYPPLPTNQLTEVGPVNWRKRYGIPGPPIPWAGAEVVPPPEESVGEPIYQPSGELAAKGAPDASKIGSTAKVPESEVRTSVGEETSLRPKGTPAGARPGEEPVSTGERTVAAEAAPPEAIQALTPGQVIQHGADRWRVTEIPDHVEPVDEHGNPLGPPVPIREAPIDIPLPQPAPTIGPSALAGGVTRRREEEETPTDPLQMTAAQLSDYLNREYYGKGMLAPTVKGVNLRRLLEDKKAAEAKAGKAAAPQEINQQPLRELLSPEKFAEYQGLQNEWTDLDFALGEAARDRDRAKVASIADHQRAIKERMRAIESTLPGGNIQDVIVIGGGAAGQAAALSGAGEGLRTTVLDIQQPGGASKQTPLYENVTGVIAQPGRERAFLNRMAGERMGAKFDQIIGLDGPPTYDENTKLWTVKTLGAGEGGAGGVTYQARTIIGGTGSRGRGAYFPIEDATGQKLTRSLMDKDPASQRLPVTGTPEDQSGVKVWLSNGTSMGQEANGGDIAAIGGANSSGQAVVDAAIQLMDKFRPAGASGVYKRPEGAGQVHMIIRGPGPEMSAPLMRKIYRLVDLGWVKLHPFQETTRIRVMPDGTKVLESQHLMKDPATGKTVPTGQTSSYPVKSIGSFVGGDPVSGWLPENFARDVEGFAVTDNQLRPLDKSGKPIDQGIFLAGSMRSGVVEGSHPEATFEQLMKLPPKAGATQPAVNRMLPSEGEGAAASVYAGSHVTKLEREGKLTGWEKEVRNFFNRAEHGGQVESVLSEPAPETVTGTKPPAREIGPRKVLPVPGGPFKLPPQTPKKPLRVEPQDTTDLARAAGGVPSQQDQGDQRQGRVTFVPYRPPTETKPTDINTAAIVEQQKATARPLTDQDRAALNAHEEGLRQQYNALADDQMNAYAAGDQERIAENDTKLSETWDKFADLNNARRRAGEPEVPLPPEQFSLEQMVKDKRAVNKGRDLTPQEMDDVRHWQELIKEKKDALEAYRIGPKGEEYRKQLAKRAEAFRTGQGPKQSLLPDPENLKKQAELINAQKDWERSLETDRKAQLAWWRKAPDYLLKWRRAFAISGWRSLAKLGAAVVEGTIILPARELAGEGLRHLPLISEAAKRAPSEGGGFNIRAEAEAQAEMWKNLVSDFGKNLRGQKPDYETVFGKFDQMPPELQNYVGYLHGAIKSPLARNEFTRTYQQVAEFEAKHGSDLTDPLVQMQIGQKAMEKSIFWRLQNKNQATRVYRQLTAAMDRGGDISRAASFVAKAELPIVTVPSNYLARTFEGVFGTELGLARLGKAYARGIETLKPEEADLIMRNLKTGLVGNALGLIGWFAPQYFGGYYRPGMKKGPDDIPFESAKFGDYEIPYYLQDNPLVSQPQYMATMRQVADSYLHMRDPDTAGLWLGFWAANYGAASSQPFVRESIDVAKAGDPRVAGDIMGEHARSYLIPQFLQQIAQAQDTADKRYPRGMAQQLMVGIPGLRESVPDVLPSSQHLGARRRGYLPKRPSITTRVRK